MLTVISAPPRTGKTLLCMQKILEFKKQGRPIYTNILGINVDGVLHLEGVFPISGTIEQPHDWRDLPNGSVVIYDEAHEHSAFSVETYVPNVDDDFYDSLIEKVEDDLNLNSAEKKVRIQAINRERKKEAQRKIQQVRDIAQSLLMHGHFGFDIILITQKPNLLNSFVQAAASEHLWLRRIWGLKMATIFEFPEIRPTFSRSARQDALSVKQWTYPKKLYGYYKSSEKHTDVLKIPPKYLVFACIPLIVIGFGVKGFMGSMFNPYNQNKQNEKSIQAPKQDTSPSIAPSNPAQTKDSESSDVDLLSQPIDSTAQYHALSQPSLVEYGCITVGQKKTCYDSNHSF